MNEKSNKENEVVQDLFVFRWNEMMLRHILSLDDVQGIFLYFGLEPKNTEWKTSYAQKELSAILLNEVEPQILVERIQGLLGQNIPIERAHAIYDQLKEKSDQQLIEDLLVMFSEGDARRGALEGQLLHRDEGACFDHEDLMWMFLESKYRVGDFSSKGS